MIDMAKLKSIRKIAQTVAIISLLLFVALISYSGYQLHLINRKVADAEKQLAETEEKEKSINAALKEKEDSIKAKQEEIDKLDKKIQTLNDILSKVGNENQTLAQNAINQTIESNPNTANILPRIYLHIIDESQRARAKQIGSQLQKRGYLVPGIENVGKKGTSLPRTQLRYFSRNDQESRDVDEIAGFLQSANVKAVSQFIDKSSGIRPRHYEIWFGLDF